MKAFFLIDVLCALGQYESAVQYESANRNTTNTHIHTISRSIQTSADPVYCYCFPGGRGRGRVTLRNIYDNNYTCGLYRQNETSVNDHTDLHGFNSSHR